MVHLNRLRKEITGPRGLLVAVIYQASRDATGKNGRYKKDALAYFSSPIYQQHLTLLGLEPSLLPTVLASGD